jgi:endoglucanase
LKETIKKLVETYGPSGFEDQMRALIRKEIGDVADSMRVTPLGNLIAVKQASRGQNPKRVMLSAHMDEIGVMVTHIDEQGYARVANIGGVFPINCTGSRVMFADGTIGTINTDRLEPGKLPGLQELYIDTGARNKASSKVKVGDAAGFWRPFVDLGERLIAKSMDDRIGCAILIETLRRLRSTPHEVHFVFSVQEEINLSGARTAAYEIDPHIAIAVDVTATGDTPKALPMAVELGGGAAIKVRDGNMVAHSGVKDLMAQRAKEAKLPYQLEILRAGTTDASVIQLTREGVPSGCLSVPCRYVHSQSEMVDTRDVEQCVELMLAILKKPIEV